MLTGICFKLFKTKIRRRTKYASLDNQSFNCVFFFFFSTGYSNLHAFNILKMCSQKTIVNEILTNESPRLHPNGYLALNYCHFSSRFNMDPRKGEKEALHHEKKR